jgi:glycosyltransferase involved in cell wall biosynthesis
MAIIEAMAMGKPVVATRAGGNPELIEDEETGLLIERNPQALANALLSILSDTDRRRRMGNAARDRASSRFSARVMAQNVESLYEEMVGRRPASLAYAS